MAAQPRHRHHCAPSLRAFVIFFFAPSPSATLPCSGPSPSCAPLRAWCSATGPGLAPAMPPPFPAVVCCGDAASNGVLSDGAVPSVTARPGEQEQGSLSAGLSLQSSAGANLPLRKVAPPPGVPGTQQKTPSKKPGSQALAGTL